MNGFHMQIYKYLASMQSLIILKVVHSTAHYWNFEIKLMVRQKKIVLKNEILKNLPIIKIEKAFVQN